MNNVYCKCVKSSCNVLLGNVRRNSKSILFDPQPINTSFLENEENLRYVSKCLAKNNHYIWVVQQQKQDWTYGEDFDEIKKIDPLLVPFEILPDEVKKKKNTLVMETLKVLRQFGYKNR